MHLLHDKDLTPVARRIARKDGREAAKEDQQKAFPLDETRAVILEHEKVAPDALERRSTS